MRVRAGTALTLVALSIFMPREAAACPFCAASSPTICEELAPAEVVVVARAVTIVAPDKRLAASGLGGSVVRYEIVEVLRGKEKLGKVRQISLADATEDKAGSVRLLTACGAPTLTWSELHRVSARGKEYVRKAVAIPSEGADRLAFFYDYLEDADEQIAQDAYNEFANAPYAEVRKLRDQMDRKKLLARTQDPKTPAARRGLLWTMVGICGTPDEAKVLEGLVREGSAASPGYFDALLAAYLSLDKEGALDTIDAEFLRSKQHAESSRLSAIVALADSHAAIRALRFHLEEQHGVPKDRILKSLRLLLDRPELASVVIADLARWEDWQALPRLVEIFKAAEKDASGLRVQVVNYLLTCPLPEATRELAELERLAPKDVAQARVIGVYGRGGIPRRQDRLSWNE